MNSPSLLCLSFLFPWGVVLLQTLPRVNGGTFAFSVEAARAKVKAKAAVAAAAKPTVPAAAPTMASRNDPTFPRIFSDEADLKRSGILIAMKEYPTEESFAADEAPPKKEPYVIRKVQSIPNLANAHVEIRGKINPFEDSFEKSKQAERTGRSQAPITHKFPVVEKEFRNAIFNFQPTHKTHSPVLLDPANEHARHTAQVSMFGFKASSSWCNGEYMGLGSIRYTLSGDRVVYVIDFGKAWGAYHQLFPPVGRSFGKFYTTVANLTKADWLKMQLIHSSLVIRKAMVSAGDVLVVPAASIVCEQTVNKIPTIGFRASFVIPYQKSEYAAFLAILEAEDKENANLGIMRACLPLYDKEGLPPIPAVKDQPPTPMPGTPPAGWIA